ncbi:MAG: amidohydrolase [Oscillospiraceae bacterium]|nr:amidohydrolase [Oscillospiraceae bacterium]
MNDILKQITETVGSKKDLLIDAADQIYGFAELSYEEERSSSLLIRLLEQEGFIVNKGVAGIPTAFVGTFGTRRPVIGFLGEYDALDGLSQEGANPKKCPVIPGAPGHGCGHSLLGTGSLGAAIAVKEYLKANNMDGTVLYFGCPAEEGAGSKQFMARAGLFDDCDFCFTWHPSTLNDVSPDSGTAFMGANFSFKGVAAHAGGSPWLGRSALDAAELMSVGCNYLREHIEDGQRIHYAYSDVGGTAPNVVQATSKVKYEVRARTVDAMKQLFERVVKVAKGAALMTETEMEYEITMAFSDCSSNRVLSEIASRCLQEVGAPKWEETDFALAKQFLDSYDTIQRNGIETSIKERFGEDALGEILKASLHTGVIPYDYSKRRYMGGSSDVGDVSYATPTCELHVATCCIGNIGHTWQMAGQANSSIGYKGMLTAATAMAYSAITVAQDPEIMQKAREEYIKKSGGRYVCPLPDDVLPPIGRY